MMRSVVFDVSGVLEAFDYRGVLIHAQEIEANQKLKLPFTQKTLEPNPTTKIKKGIK